VAISDPAQERSVMVDSAKVRPEDGVSILFIRIVNDAKLTDIHRVK